jgi:hypothetical protein
MWPFGTKDGASLNPTKFIWNGSVVGVLGPEYPRHLEISSTWMR